MNTRRYRSMTVLSLALVLIAAGLAVGCSHTDSIASENAADHGAVPHIMASSDIEAGRYLINVAACHDCHTPGFMENPAVPEDLWLTGSPMGWRGPWGTTYGSNLRLTVQTMSEDDWVTTLRTRKTNPPMPWPMVANLSERDSRAIYRYIKSLPVVGEKMPDWVPPDQEPHTPYLSMMPLNLPTE